MALGVLFVLIGALSLTALVDLILESTFSGTVEPTLFGVGLASQEASDAAVIAAGLGVAAVVLVSLGIIALRRGAGGQRGRRHEALNVREAGLEARARLLDYRVKVLRGHIRALEERKADLEREVGPAELVLSPVTTPEEALAAARTAAEESRSEKRKEFRKRITASEKEKEKEEEPAGRLVVVPDIEAEAAAGGDGSKKK